MLVQFSVENFLSFKEKMTFNMTTHKSMNEHEETHVFEHEDFRFLKSAVLYGANASGKSNLFVAMGRMKMLMLNSSKESQANEEIEVEAFKLSTETENSPSLFEIVFIYNHVLYRYGFVADRKRIHEEWLYYRPDLKKKKEIELFARDGDSIKIKPKTIFTSEAKGLESKTRKNALFISVVANFNGKVAMDILEWIKHLDFLSGIKNPIDYTLEMLSDPIYKMKILNFIRIADLDIEDLHMEKIDLTQYEFPNDIPKEVTEHLSGVKVAISAHKKFNENKEQVGLSLFDVNDNESEGTKKFLGLAGPILEKFEKGGVLVVDELDAKLHPLLTRKIIEMFNSYDINANNAQLIFATHDVTNLTKDIFRRDQVWFTEKDHYGVTDLYSLADYKQEQLEKKVRNDASYGKDYLLGKYGAIPNIGDLHLFLEDNDYGN
ncbi:ATP-binding protein [Paenibacillus sp. KS-LC4]|uniref:AAA family ATPase n=1 Tax=Paenibacillus sp. KS-LC4 TaxID=2979727 RepID=UPI0030CBF26D